jgi:N-acetylglucosamine kinase-like BadF-type ATPase
MDVKRFNAEDAEDAQRTQEKAAHDPSSALKSSLFIGIDGGGTGTRARIADGECRVLGAGTAAPAAVRLGINHALAAVHDAARAAAADAGLPRA